MPYQDRHPLDLGAAEASPSDTVPSAAQREPNSSRNIQIIIAIGLLAAIAVAVIGRY